MKSSRAIILGENHSYNCEINFGENITILKEYNKSIRNVIFNDPATIVLWEDGTKTVAKCDERDKYDKLTGLLICISKKFMGATEIKRTLDRFVY